MHAQTWVGVFVPKFAGYEIMSCGGGGGGGLLICSVYIGMPWTYVYQNHAFLSVPCMLKFCISRRVRSRELRGFKHPPLGLLVFLFIFLLFSFFTSSFLFFSFFSSLLFFSFLFSFFLFSSLIFFFFFFSFLFSSLLFVFVFFSFLFFSFLFFSFFLFSSLLFSSFLFISSLLFFSSLVSFSSLLFFRFFFSLSERTAMYEDNPLPLTRIWTFLHTFFFSFWRKEKVSDFQPTPTRSAFFSSSFFPEMARHLFLEEGKSVRFQPPPTRSAFFGSFFFFQGWRDITRPASDCKLFPWK